MERVTAKSPDQSQTLGDIASGCVREALKTPDFIDAS